jgi:YNFM family putative membrane transporter
VVRQLADAFTDPVLLGLYGLAALLMGGFVAVYNAATFRLEAPPYALSPALSGLVFVTYLLGSGSSAAAGELAGRVGRRPVVPVAVAVMAGGIALTLADPLPLFVGGLCVLTIGFFAAHAVASGWVARRAVEHRAQASALYLLLYYLGASVGGAAGGLFWDVAGWPGVVGMILLVLALAFAVSIQLSRIPPLEVA